MRNQAQKHIFKDCVLISVRWEHGVGMVSWRDEEGRGKGYAFPFEELDYIAKSGVIAFEEDGCHTEACLEVESGQRLFWAVRNLSEILRNNEKYKVKEFSASWQY